MSLKKVLLKAGILFIGLDLLFALLSPIPWLERISAYNHLFQGRLRLPFGENSAQAYNLSLFQVDAMLRSHELAKRPGQVDAYRVVVIGDSSVWGYLLQPDLTLTAYLNRLDLRTPEGSPVRFYNLGYPTMSLAKDLLILHKALAYQPDMIIWLLTLESLPQAKQLTSPIVQHNPLAMRELIRQYSLSLDPEDQAFVRESFWEKTLAGQRRALADLFRLQLYGVMWAATGIDQYYPDHYEPPQKDLEADELFQGISPPDFKPGELSFDILQAGAQMSRGKPFLVVNEPIYLSQGLNSNIRYNFFYPRWAFDRYRQLLEDKAREQDWPYLDAWNLVPPENFTNSAIHLNPAGTQLLAESISELVQSQLK